MLCYTCFVQFNPLSSLVPSVSNRGQHRAAVRALTLSASRCHKGWGPGSAKARCSAQSGGLELGGQPGPITVFVSPLSLVLVLVLILVCRSLSVCDVMSSEGFVPGQFDDAVEDR